MEHKAIQQIEILGEIFNIGDIVDSIIIDNSKQLIIHDEQFNIKSICSCGIIDFSTITPDHNGIYSVCSIEVDKITYIHKCYKEDPNIINF